MPVNLEEFRIELVRVSRGFAHSRLQRALRMNREKNAPSSSIDSMYAQYLAASSISSMDTMYSQRLRQANEEQSLDVSNGPDYSFHLKPFPGSEGLTRVTGYHIKVLTDKVSRAPCSPLQEPWIIIRQQSARLHPHSLNKALEKIADSKGLTLLYADHDHVKPDKARVHPCFKTGWNPGLLRQGNYIGDVILIKQSVYLSAGGLDASMGASALFDLLLRLSGILNDYEIHHLPEMLFSLPADNYHAPHGFSIARKDREALERFASAEKSQENAIGPVVSKGPYPGLFQLHYPLPVDTPSVDIIIPTRDQPKLLERCVRSILDLTAYYRFNIVVIDNDSELEDTSRFHEEFLKKEARYRLLHYPGEFNYSAINNSAVRTSKADIVVLLNNDTEIMQADWLSQLVAEALQPDVACVGAKLVYGNGLVQHVGVVAGMQGVAGHVNRYMQADEDGYGGMLQLSPDTSAVTGACLAIRRKVFEQLNGLDEENLTIAFNDVDLCLRAREFGYRNRLLAQVRLVHHESVSRGHDDSKEKALRFKGEIDFMLKRHKYWIDDDPAWNSNFSRHHHFPVLKDRETYQDDLQAAEYYAA